jgi:predicted GNAT family N-acyltransferase
MTSIVFKQATGKAELNGAFSVRREVFIVEQEIDEAEEWDGLDDACLHFVAKSGRKVVGTARVRFPELGHAKIERMAVLKPQRRQGIGAGILACLEQTLREKRIDEAVLHAQITAVPFYLSCGYEADGAHFYEANIEHVKMAKRLSSG